MLRGPSAFSEGERELVAAYVSALNGCRFCFTAHRAHALAWHIAPEVFGEMSVDMAHASLRPAMRPVLAYAKTLTLDPHTIAAEQAEAFYAAGFDEAALSDLIRVVSRIFGTLGLPGCSIRQPCPAA